MPVKVGKIGNMSYYIGQEGKEYKAEVKVDGQVKSKVFPTFAAAVSWVENEQKIESKRLEDQRSKEEA